MTSRALIHIASGGLAAALLAIGCATGTVDFQGTSSSGASTTSAGGAGGGSATVGAGGHGGGPDLPCGIDCAKVVKPSPCHVATCNMMTLQCQLEPLPNDSDCQDGLFCTVQDKCQGGMCVGGSPNTCATTAPPCHEMTCDETTKTCAPTPAMDGSFCTPDDKCVINSFCQFGTCTGMKNDCKFNPPPDKCHVMVCDPADGMCKPQVGNEGLSCDPDPTDLCAVNKKCSAGVCIGGNPKDCSALTKGCNNGKCDTSNGKCFADPVPPGSNCLEATDQCNQGKCDMLGKCAANPINEGQACSTPLKCVMGAKCASGSCTGGVSNVTIYFFDDFASNAKGWTLDTEWAIGGAKVSMGNVYGNPDPGKDHSGNVANGVAGVVIGGNANTVLHDFYWLTSPAVDTSKAGTVYFEYWRWLNSDYLPYMQNKVEVYDGAKWVNLFSSGNSPGVTDNAWTKVTNDLSAYKNAQMRVRFGFNIGSGGVLTVAKWNVDDVLIASGPCN